MEQVKVIITTSTPISLKVVQSNEKKACERLLTDIKNVGARKSEINKEANARNHGF